MSQVGTEGPYIVGQPFRVKAEFQNVLKQDADPTTVTLKYVAPGAARTTIVTPDSRIVKDSVGNYHADLDTTGTTPGRWTYRWEGAGALIGADDGTCVVKASPLSP